jgi:hypothetical protein
VSSEVKKLTDRWQLICTYDPVSKEIKPILYGDNHWRSKRFSYDSDNMQYKGFHEAIRADTSSTDWRVWKYTWDATPNPILIEGPLIGSWDDRASLDWE